MSGLPTWEQVVDRALAELDGARSGLSKARDWLRSDWRRVGSPLPGAAADARGEALGLVGHAKGLVDRAKSVLYGAVAR